MRQMSPRTRSCKEVENSVDNTKGDMNNAKGKRGKSDVREVLAVQSGLSLEGEAEAEGRKVSPVPQPAAPGGALPEVGAVAGREARDSTPINPDRWIDDMVGCLCDPIIVWPGGWGDSLPEDIKARITLGRMHQMLKKEQLACDAEVMAYMYTLTLTRPVSEAWTRIYMYVFTREMGDKAPEDLRQDELNNYDMGQLRDLKRWLWTTRVKARKERGRQERREVKAEVEARAPKQMGLPL